MAEKGVKRSSIRDLIRVGVITGPGGHTTGGWGDRMNPPPGSVRTTGMVMTHLWSLRRGVAESFTARYPDVEVVGDPRDMLDQIDGVFLDDINAISLYPQLARPFLEAGVPTFVNRPFATSLAKGREMVDTAARCGTALYTASTWEATESVGDLRAKVAEMPDIKGYVAHNSMSDYYTHGLHGVWYIHAVLCDEIKKGRGRVAAASYLTPNWRTPGGLVVYEHESPTGPYYGSLQLVSGADGQAYMRIFGNHSGDAEGKIPARPGHFFYNTWNALQLIVQEMFETGESPATGDELMEKLTMFLLPFRSVLERDGAPVRREELDDWEAPWPSQELVEDGQPSDNTFKAPYTEAELADLEKRLT